MRTDDVTAFKKNQVKNSMQMSYGLYSVRHFVVDLAYLEESVENTFLVVSFTRKKHYFQPSVKKWRIIQHMASKQQFLPEKLSKFNSTLLSDWFI